MSDSTKCDCPVCKGKGTISMEIQTGPMHSQVVRKPCIHCANSGNVEYKDWVKMTGREQ